MTQQIQEIWKRFADLEALATSQDAKLIINAIGLHAQLTNLRLAPIPQEIAAILGRRQE